MAVRHNRKVMSVVAPLALELETKRLHLIDFLAWRRSSGHFDS